MPARARRRFDVLPSPGPFGGEDDEEEEETQSEEEVEGWFSAKWAFWAVVASAAATVVIWKSI